MSLPPIGPASADAMLPRSANAPISEYVHSLYSFCTQGASPLFSCLTPFPQDLDISTVQISDLHQRQIENGYTVQEHTNRGGKISHRFCIIASEKHDEKDVIERVAAWLEKNLGERPISLSNENSNQHRIILCCNGTELFGMKSSVAQDLESISHIKAFFRIESLRDIMKKRSSQQKETFEETGVAPGVLPQLPLGFEQKGDPASQPSTGRDCHLIPSPPPGKLIGEKQDSARASPTTATAHPVNPSVLQTIPQDNASEELGEELDAPFKLPFLRNPQGGLPATSSRRPSDFPSMASKRSRVDSLDTPTPSMTTVTNIPLVDAVVTSLLQIGAEENEQVRPERVRKIADRLITAIVLISQKMDSETPELNSCVKKHIGASVIEAFTGKMHLSTFTTLTDLVLRTLLNATQLTSIQKEKIQPLFTNESMDLWRKLFERIQKKDPILNVETYELSSLYGISYAMIERFAAFARLEMIDEISFSEHQQSLKDTQKNIAKAAQTISPRKPRSSFTPPPPERR